MLRRRILAPAVFAVTLALGTAIASSGPPDPQAQPPSVGTQQPPDSSQPQARAKPHPRNHAGDWLRKYKDLPLDQQDKALESDPDFRKLPADRQAQLRDRLHRFSKLPPQQKQAILHRMETWEHLTHAQKQQAKAVYGKISQLPPDRRVAVTKAIQELRQIPPQQREPALDSEKYRSQFSEQERDMLKGVLRLPLAPVHAQNEAPAPDQTPH
jgi:uncharacterized protein DUF3106